MRNYLYISESRTNSFYNQLVEKTPVEIIRREMDKNGILTDWKASLKAGFTGLVSADARYSKVKNKEREFEENIRFMIEFEQKIKFIEENIRFENIEELLTENQSVNGRPVRYIGGYYSKGLKNPTDYTGKEWDGLLPFLYKNIMGLKIKIVYSPLNFLSQTPWAIVRGRLTIDGIGFTSMQNRDEIIITPIAFGLYVSDTLADLL